MSALRMTPFERNQRSLARGFGREALQFIDLASSWNRTGAKYVDAAYELARQAARHAAQSLDAHAYRARPRRLGARKKGGTDGGSRA
jgi:hypothetical protein